MDDAMSESEFVGPDSTTEDEHLCQQGWDELPSSEVAENNAPSLATVESSHVYETLSHDCIRLLRIVPGKPNDELRCEIHQYALDERTEYTALSYTWGGEPAEYAIRLNGKRIYVRKNLWRFLQQARKMDDRLMKLLWIDALCIDQSNYLERSRQVSLMPQIYGIATKALVWLGPSYASSDSAMQALAMPLSKWLARGTLLGLWSRPLGGAICGLCYRAYWSRLWIFQELLLAREVQLMCGSMTLPFQALQDVLDTAAHHHVRDRHSGRLEYKATAVSPAVSIISHIMLTRLPQYSQHYTLLGLMEATQGLRCSDVKDRIFALLGVASHMGNSDLEADYNVPPVILINDVLRNEYHFHPPQYLGGLQVKWEHLAEMLGLESEAIYKCVGARNPPPELNDSDIEALLSYHRDKIRLLWWATYYDHVNIRGLLLEGNKSGDFLLDAAAKGALSVIEFLLGTGASIVDDIKNLHGQPALHAAAEHGHEAAVELLLSKFSADVNSVRTSVGGNGRTALHEAAEYGREPVVARLLYKYSAQTEKKDYLGYTPFGRAIQMGQVTIAKLFYKFFLDLDQLPSLPTPVVAYHLRLAVQKTPDIWQEEDCKELKEYLLGTYLKEEERPVRTYFKDESLVDTHLKDDVPGPQVGEKARNKKPGWLSSKWSKVTRVLS